MSLGGNSNGNGLIGGGSIVCFGVGSHGERRNNVVSGESVESFYELQN